MVALCRRPWRLSHESSTRRRSMGQAGSSSSPELSAPSLSSYPLLGEGGGSGKSKHCMDRLIGLALGARVLIFLLCHLLTMQARMASSSAIARTAASAFATSVARKTSCSRALFLLRRAHRSLNTHTMAKQRWQMNLEPSTPTDPSSSCADTMDLCQIDSKIGRGTLLLGAAKGHSLLRPAWDDDPVSGSGVVVVRSDVRYDEEGQR